MSDAKPYGHNQEPLGDDELGELIERLVRNDAMAARLGDRLKATVDALNTKIDQWRALHEKAEWHGAAYLEALREAMKKATLASNNAVSGLIQRVGDKNLPAWTEDYSTAQEKLVSFGTDVYEAWVAWKALREIAAKIEAALEGKKP